MNDAVPGSTPSKRGAALAATSASAAAVAATLLVLDLTWLGLVTRPFYDAALGTLRRPEVYWPAGGLFYVFYVAAVVAIAVLRTASVRAAALRGAELGLVAYGTYELTNWAVLRDWPAVLVPVDVVWGVALTAAAAAAGKLVEVRLATPRGQRTP